MSGLHNDVGIPALVEANKRRILADYEASHPRRLSLGQRIALATSIRLLTVAIFILDRIKPWRWP